MSVKQRYRFTPWLVLLIFTIVGPCLSQATGHGCMGFYNNPNSIVFGQLLQQAQTLSELEFLNQISSRKLQFAMIPKPEEHLINSLIFYKRALDLKIDKVLPKEMYLYILNHSAEHLKAFPKFQLFLPYLQENLD